MKVTLPGNWESITIKQFCEVSRVKDSSSDKVQKLVNLVSILSNLPVETVSTFSVNDLKTAISAVSFIYGDVEGELKEEIEIDGIKYKACLDLRKMSAGQYLDLKSYTEDPKEIIYNIHNILSVFFIPEGKEYNDVPSNEIAELFYSKCPVSIAYPVSVFFCQLYKGLKLVTADYLAKEGVKKVS
jgi:hypothetical protein